MSNIGWDDQGDEYSAWDRIRDERRAERERLEKRIAYVTIGEKMAEDKLKHLRGK